MRDILGKEDVQATTAAPCRDIAEACLEQIAAREFDNWPPSSASRTSPRGPAPAQPCEMVILALGKFGGQEMNYYSDLDIIFLYEADGQTAASPVRAARRPPPTSISSANWGSGSSRPPAG